MKRAVVLSLSCAWVLACGDKDAENDEYSECAAGDLCPLGYECIVGFCLPSDEAGDGDTTGDGDGDSGDGDSGDGDGDGEPPGDGDGEPTGDGDGDGEPTGDGDGDPGPSCGDGIVNGDEECDDGNNVDDDSCSNQCLSTLYWAVGPQLDVPEDALVGWSECWSGLYGTTYPNLTSTILGQNCTGSKLLLACRPTDASTFTLLAMGERADVLFDVGTQTNGTHEANGVAWYFSNDFSMGFASAGDQVTRNECDVADLESEYRLCWHTIDDQMFDGFRCGADSIFDGAEFDSWERIIYQAD